MSENPSTKVHLTNFLKMIGAFKPELDTALVNENNPQGWTGKYNYTGRLDQAKPTQDQIINHAFAAMGDVKLFISEHETAKKDLQDLRVDALQVHKLLMQAGISTNDMAEGVSIILNRFKQALDVITKASTIESKKLDAFQTAARDFVLRFTRPENTDKQFRTEPSEHKATPSILEAPIKPEGDTGANQNSSN